MAASVRRQEEDAPLAAMNVVPLIDIMLVLLIIFMITAPMMQQGVEVNLPKATSAPLEGKDEQIVISIDKAGRIFLGAGNEIDTTEIGKKMSAIMERRKPEDRKVYIKGDTDIQYGVIMKVMGRLHQAGITQIGLVSGFPDANEKKELSSKGK